MKDNIQFLRCAAGAHLRHKSCKTHEIMHRAMCRKLQYPKSREAAVVILRPGKKVPHPAGAPYITSLKRMHIQYLPSVLIHFKTRHMHKCPKKTSGRTSSGSAERSAAKLTASR